MFKPILIRTQKQNLRLRYLIFALIHIKLKTKQHLDKLVNFVSALLLQKQTNKAEGDVRVSFSYQQGSL